LGGWAGTDEGVAHTAAIKTGHLLATCDKQAACSYCPPVTIHARPAAGGQASNVATFVAHGDVALSVLMTAGKRAAEGG